MSDGVVARYREVRERIERACDRYGRDPASVRLVAISKLQSAEAVAAVAGAGQEDFGENYLQEAEAKREALASAGHGNLRWHMTGHLQRRKAKAAAGAFELIHTVDSVALADALERHLGDAGLTQRVLLQVNIGGEEQKSGVAPEGLAQLAEHIIGSCPRLRLEGLMCLPPVWDAGDEARPHFARCRGLLESLRRIFGLGMPELSMGMSGDFEAAVAEGATLVRIGSAIFGPRS
ncbi:MAG: YggS family pyridoxal phosphate-dependent enzyme [Desulfovibrio sp.]|nr:YggS family pyridoxal phosphate-dependent enzyme [Desulfovibrio sp.]